MYTPKRKEKTRHNKLFIILIITAICNLIMTNMVISRHFDCQEENINNETIIDIDTNYKTTNPKAELISSIQQDTISDQQEKPQVIEDSLVFYSQNKTEELSRPESYVVKDKDSLWKIAANFYGSGSYYPYIISTNNMTSEYVIEGQTLTLNHIKDSEKESILEDCFEYIEKSKSNKSSNKSTSTKENMTYIGEFKITGYDICMSCCGKVDGITASGTVATVGRTIATDKRYPFGTKIYIEGLGTYVVEDRGGAIKNNKIDVLVNNHKEAYAITGRYKCYIVK